jgi:hypothetical protein
MKLVFFFLLLRKFRSEECVVAKRVQGYIKQPIYPGTAFKSFIVESMILVRVHFFHIDTECPHVYMYYIYCAPRRDHSLVHLMFCSCTSSSNNHNKKE